MAQEQDPPPGATPSKASSQRPATLHSNFSMGNRNRRSLSFPSTTAASSSFRLLTTSALLLLRLPLPASPSSSSSTGTPHPYPPEQEEYDPVIFDSNTLFGAPLGGYARATRSRLARIPLRFVGGAGYDLGGGPTADAAAAEGEEEEEGDEKPEVLLKGRHHFSMTDGDGRKFACAVYDEDELEPTSAREGAFDPPRPRVGKRDAASDDDVGPETEEAAAAAAAAALQLTEGTTAALEVSPPSEEIPEEGLRQRHPARQRGQQQQQQGRRGGGGVDSSSSASGGAGRKTTSSEQHPMSPWTANDPIKIHPDDIKRQLSKLSGTCAQLHDGWWSYEWCHEGRVTQFHVSIDQKRLDEAIAAGRYDPNTGRGEVPKFSVESVTSIGSFAERHVVVDDGRGHRHRSENDGPGELSGAIEVRETYELGDVCDVTGEPRRADVHIRCCPEGKTKESSPGEDQIATLLKVAEHETCDYRLSVCTPLLCHRAFREMSFEHNVVNRGNAGATGAADAAADGEGGEEQQGGPAALLGGVFHFNIDGDGGGGFDVPQEVVDKVNAIVAAKVGDVVDMLGAMGKKPGVGNKVTKKPKRIENESVRDILDRTLGNVCLQKDQGWWVYEFCHGRYVREFHPATVMDRVTGLTKQAVEEEHKLGLYDSDELEGYPDRDEWRRVVNATDESSPLDVRDDDDGGGRPSRGSSSNKGIIGGTTHSHGGNGAVFEQEYRGGDVCDHSDVTDSAIKGGTVDSGRDGKRGIERSTTVRFSCGKTFEFVKMNEDSTCHYQFEITVPDLCHHPLFKAEVVKTQVVKCLPV